MPTLPAGGAVTVGTTAVQVRTDSVRTRHGVVLRAAPSNSGIVYVGFVAGVTVDNGFPLLAGESLSLEVADLNQVYVIASVAAQSVRWVFAHASHLTPHSGGRSHRPRNPTP